MWWVKEQSRCTVVQALFLRTGVVLVLASAVGCTAGTPVGQAPSRAPSTAAPSPSPAKDAAVEDYQRKIDGQLRQAIEAARGPAAAASPVLSPVRVAADGTITISIRATVTDAVVAQIESTGAQVMDTNPALNTINARAPLDAIEPIAKLPDVVFVVPQPQGTTRTDQPTPSAPVSP